MSSPSNQPGKPKPQAATPSSRELKPYYGESAMNRALVDPDRWGWSAVGGISDLLPPLEAARRKSSGVRKRERPKKRDRTGNFVQRQPSGSLKQKGPPVPPKAPPQMVNGNHPASTASQPAESKIATSAPTATAGVEIEITKPDDTTKPVASTNLIQTTSDALSMKERADPIPANGSESLPHHNPAKNDASGQKEPIHFRALKDDGTLDTLAYHRGREGKELRDKETGQFLCDVEATDTSAGVERFAPVASVLVKFPLTDVAPSSEVAPVYFRETIEWDLSDPQTPTPMLFATEISSQYGLSFTQTLELAESIQGQVQSFVNDYCKFADPISLKSAAVHDKVPLYAPTLYGSVTDSEKEGLLRLAKKRKKPASRAMSARSERLGRRPSKATKGPGKATGRSSGKIPGKQRKEKKEQPMEEQAEPMYKEEVLKRLLDASQSEIADKSKQGDAPATLVGSIKPTENAYCHLCRFQQPLCGQFACGSDYHAYCRRHLDEELKVVLSTDGSPPALDYCPICSCSCKCQPCATRLNRTALDMKKKCQEQNFVPGNVSFDGILLHCRSKESKVRGARPANRGRRRKAEVSERQVVPKVPLAEFPREIFNGNDLDPGTDADYATVFSEKGSFTPTQIPSTVATTLQATPIADAPTLDESGTASMAEDGSVDFCNICRKVGNLLCCDFCPRAFHQNCIGKQGLISDQSDAVWECPACCDEKKGLPEDRVDGEKPLPAIAPNFKESIDETAEPVKAGLRQLSIINQIVLRLMDYDFGYIFREPVDCEAIPTYRDFVKHPMDLGTISTNLTTGRYLKEYEKRKSFDDAVIAVLNDIELVWHNCYVFNYEGSAVYRMAEVQQRRAQAMRDLNLDTFLSDRVKQETAEFVSVRNRERGKFRRSDPSPVEKSGNQPASNTRPQARRKISVSGNGVNGRPIAVLDPDTGLIAKIYSTMQAGFLTSQLFLSLGYKSEYKETDLNKSVKIRKIVLDCGCDPGILLFGYRWVFWDDLKAGKIGFFSEEPKREQVRAKSDSKEESASNHATPEETESPRLVEMTGTDGHALVFSSSREALAYAGVSSSDPTSKLRAYLQCDDPAYNHVDPDGRTWSVTPKDSLVDLSLTEGVVVVKRDLLSSRNLMGFRSVDVAYQDWLRTREGTPNPSNEPSSLEVFRERYLEGSDNIDGVEWNKTKEFAGRRNEEPAEPFTSSSNLKDLGEEPVRNGCNHASTSTAGEEGMSQSENNGGPSMGVAAVV